MMAGCEVHKWCEGLRVCMAGVDTGRLNKLVKRSFNLCPISWMPVCVGKRGDEAKLWCCVQVAFKNKPSESTENTLTTERNRRLHAFGMPFADYNCNGAHFLHRSSNVQGAMDWDSVWLNPPINDTAPVKFELYGVEPRKSGRFFKTTCVENGIFNKLTDSASSAAPSEISLFKLIQDGFDVKLFDPVVLRIFTLFAGCKDCNGKMTINEYTADLFDLFYDRTMFELKTTGDGTDSQPKTRRWNPGVNNDCFSNEVSIHYLLLSGMVNSADINETNGTFYVKDLSRPSSCLVLSHDTRFSILLQICLQMGLYF